MGHRAFRVKIRPVLGALGIALTGCAETPNFETPSTFDMIFRYDTLQEHLAERRRLLENLQGEARAAEASAQRSLGMLRAAEQESATLEHSNAANAQGSAELEALRSELSIAYDELARARSEVDRLRREEPSRQEQVAADRSAIAMLNERVARLDQQIAALEQAIQDAISSRKRVVLRQSS